MEPWRCVATGKVKYATEEAATSAARGMLVGGLGLTRVYRCVKCLGYHVTSQVRPPVWADQVRRAMGESEPDE